MPSSLSIKSSINSHHLCRLIYLPCTTDLSAVALAPLPRSAGTNVCLRDLSAQRSTSLFTAFTSCSFSLVMRNLLHSPYDDSECIFANSIIIEAQNAKSLRLIVFSISSFSALNGILASHPYHASSLSLHSSLCCSNHSSVGSSPFKWLYTPLAELPCFIGLKPYQYF